MLLVYNLHHYYVSRLRFGFYLFPQQDSNLHSLESKSSVLTNYTMEKYLRGRRGTRTHKSISRPTCFQDKLLIQPVAFLIAVIVGLEPTTLMLTASCSTIELYDLVRFGIYLDSYPGRHPIGHLSKELQFQYAYILLLRY